MMEFLILSKQCKIILIVLLSLISFIFYLKYLSLIKKDYEEIKNELDQVRDDITSKNDGDLINERIKKIKEIIRNKNQTIKDSYFESINMNFLLNIFEKLLTTMSSCTIITIMLNYQALYDNNHPLNKLLMFIWQYTPIVLFPILMIYIAHNTVKSCLSIALYGDKLFDCAKYDAVLLIIFIPAIITIILFSIFLCLGFMFAPLSSPS